MSDEAKKKMTPRQAAMTAILAAAAAGGGYVAPATLQDVLQSTCKHERSVAESIVKDATGKDRAETKITVGKAFNIVGQNCEHTGAARLVEKVELSLLKGTPDSPAVHPQKKGGAK